MALDREAIYAALAAHLQAKVGSLLKTATRRVIPTLSRLGADEHPTIAVYADTEVPTIDDDGRAVWTLYPRIAIYAHVTNPATTAETEIAGLVKAIEEALAWTPADLADGEVITPGQLEQAWTTLGGLVRCVRPAGPIVYAPGHVQEQGLAEVPLEIITVPA